jgi:Raf kinase inhibitor-like YbhB/YbcL family protein
MTQELNVGELRVESPNFDHLGRIPKAHTDDGDNHPLVLEWSGVPEGTKSFAVVMHDPDAPLVDGFSHWVLYGIPGDVRALGEGDGERYTAGVNSSGSESYMGPAPPPGHGLHHYYVWLYALDSDTELPPHLDRRALLQQIEDHVIEQARVIGVYER